jgi:hypothetical protein
MEMNYIQNCAYCHLSGTCRSREDKDARIAELEAEVARYREEELIGYMVQDGDGRICRYDDSDTIHWNLKSAEIHRARADEVHGFTEPWHKICTVKICPKYRKEEGE